jgi:hypothetical protein
LGELRNLKFQISRKGPEMVHLLFGFKYDSHAFDIAENNKQIKINLEG